MKGAYALASVSALAIGLGVVGCGGSQTAETPQARQAVADGGETTTCPEISNTFTFSSVVQNKLPEPIMLKARDYTCSDWSGVSTPGHAFTGKVIQPGEKLPFVLEARRSVVRTWTMEITGANGAPSLGAARLTIPTEFDPGLTRIKMVGATIVRDRNGFKCDVLPMEKARFPATPMSQWPAPFWKVPLGVISYDGAVAFVGNCNGRVSD